MSHRPQDAGPGRRRAELGQRPLVHTHDQGLAVPVGDAVVDPPGVRRPLVGVGAGDCVYVTTPLHYAATKTQLDELNRFS